MDTEHLEWRDPMKNLLLLSASVIFLITSTLGQLTVDATGPIRESQREEASGRGGSSGGGIGRKLSIQVAVETTGAPADENGKTVVEFTLTNSGKTDLNVPISPHPGDFEPADPKASYKVEMLSLFITSNKKATDILSGSAHLYGSDAVPGTLLSLATGESIRVLLRVAFAKSSTSVGEVVFVGHATLNNEAIKMVNGQTVLEFQEIGSAASPEYTSEALKLFK
jgi:hypothetical protein